MKGAGEKDEDDGRPSSMVATARVLFQPTSMRTKIDKAKTSIGLKRLGRGNLFAVTQIQADIHFLFRCPILEIPHSAGNWYLRSH